MGQGQDEKRKGSALANAAVATASVALGYAALELGFGGVLKPGRDAINKSLLEPEEDHQLPLESKSDEAAEAPGSTTSAPSPETHITEPSDKFAASAVPAASADKRESS